MAKHRGEEAREALTLAEADLDYRRGALLVRSGKGGRRREVGMDAWAWDELQPTIGSIDLKASALKDAGLGAGSRQLKLKLGIVTSIWKRFAQFGLPWLDDLLDAINDVLSSIPGAEALEELQSRAP